MIKYIKTKLLLYKMKKSFCELFLHADDIIHFILNLVSSCQHLTGDELRKEVIQAIAGLAHDAAQKERETQKGTNIQ